MMIVFFTPRKFESMEIKPQAVKIMVKSDTFHEIKTNIVSHV